MWPSLVSELATGTQGFARRCSRYSAATSSVLTGSCNSNSSTAVAYVLPWFAKVLSAKTEEEEEVLLQGVRYCFCFVQSLALWGWYVHGRSV
jgi:hypothetical protein